MSGPEQEPDGDGASEPKQDHTASPIPTSVSPGGSILGTMEPIACPPSKEQPNAQRNGPAPVAEITRLEKQNNRIQWLLAIIAAVGMVIAGLQLQVMRVQNGIMEVQNKLVLAQQRPWISLTIRAEKPKSGQRFPITFDLTNEGQSTGEATRINFDLLYFELGKQNPGVGIIRKDNFKWRDTGDQRGTSLQIHTEFQGYRLSLDEAYKFEERCGAISLEGVLRPGSALAVSAAKGEALSDNTVAKIRDGRILPVAIAYAFYADASRQIHRTRFTGYYNRKTGEFERIPNRSEME